MNKEKRNNTPASNLGIFLKTVILTTIAILLVVFGFISAGYFAGAFR